MEAHKAINCPLQNAGDERETQLTCTHSSHVKSRAESGSAERALCQGCLGNFVLWGVHLGTKFGILGWVEIEEHS